MVWWEGTSGGPGRAGDGATEGSGREGQERGGAAGGWSSTPAGGRQRPAGPQVQHLGRAAGSERERMVEMEGYQRERGEGEMVDVGRTSVIEREIWLTWVGHQSV